MQAKKEKAIVGFPDDIGTNKTYQEVAGAVGLPLDRDGMPKSVTFGRKEEKGELFWDYNSTSGKLMYAAVIPDNLSTPVEYLDDAEEYDENNTKYEDIVEHAWKLYKNEGYAGTCVDTIIDNAVVDRGYVDNVEDQDTRKLLESWLAKVNAFDEAKTAKKGKAVNPAVGIKPAGGIEGVCQQAILHMLVTGDWVAMERWNNVLVDEVGGKKNIPVTIKTMNNLDLEFDTAAAQIGMDVIYWKVPEDVKTAITKPDKDNPSHKIIEENTADWIKSEIKKGAEKIQLPSDYTTHLRRRERDYDPHGISYLQRFLGPAADKLRLRALDRSTVVGLIQRLTIIMMGHDQTDHPLAIPDPARFNLLKNALKKLKTDMFMVWGGKDLSVLDIGPDGKVLELQFKYAEVNDDARRASGLPPILTEGVTNQGGRDLVALINTISKVENIRVQLERWINRKLREICLENGKKDIFPRFRFRLLNLRDERTIKANVLKTYEDGLLPREVALNEIGYDGLSIIDKHLKEKASGIDDQIGPPPVAWGVTKSGDRATNPEPGRPANTKETETRAFLIAAQDEDEDEDVLQIKQIYDITSEFLIEKAKEGLLASTLMNLVNPAFSAFNDFTDQLIAKYAEDMGIEDTWMMKLYIWNQGYVTRFVNQIKAYINKNETMDRESFAIAFAIWMTSFRDVRVPMYVAEIRHKVKITEHCADAQKRGIAIIRRRSAGDENVCGECIDQDGQVMSIDAFWASVPSHPHCRCYPEDVIEGL